MPTFYEALDAALLESKGGDRTHTVNVIIEVDFGSGPIRLWGGIGEMETPDGLLWTGFLEQGEDADEVRSAIQLPQKIDDIRSGNSVPYEFALGYMDDERYNLLRTSPAETEGKLIKIGYVAMPAVGLKSVSDIGHLSLLRITGRPKWSEQRRREDDGSIKVYKSASIRAVGANAGRSRTGGVLLTPTNQKFRSEILHGVTDDKYAEFVPLINTGLDLQF